METNFKSIAATRWRLSKLVLVIFSLLFSLLIQAHADEADLEDLTLDELSNVKVSVDTGILQSQDRTPSSVLVVTREQIERSGARDLADILRSLPGFEFAIDTVDYVGLAYRGIWVHEGKILLLVDGNIMNDPLYNLVNYLRSYPAFMIEKVEILRGPGSAIYGGLAQTGVISVTTRRGSQLKGLKGEGTVGGMGATTASDFGMGSAGSDSAIYGSHLAFGQKYEDAEYSLHLGTNKGPMSMRPYTDFNGSQIPGGDYMTDRDETDVVINVAYKDLNLHYDRLTLLHGGQDGYTAVVPPISGYPADQILDYADHFSANYTAHMSQNMNVKTTADYSEGAGEYLNAAAYYGGFTGSGLNQKRYHAEVQADWLLPTEKTNNHQVTAGAGVIRNELTSFLSTSVGIFGGGAGGPSAGNQYFFADDSQYIFAQYLKEYTGGSFTSGARYEKTPYGNAFAPRIGVTYIHDSFNAKLLYGKAFRVPTILQMLESGNLLQTTVNANLLHPEISNTYEAELGYRFSANLQTVLSLFLIHIDQPLIYNSASSSTYANSSLIETRGFELQFLGKHGNWDWNASGSYAQPGPATSPNYTTSDGRYFIGSPPFKANLGGSYSFSRLTIGPSFEFLSQRYGQSSASALATTFYYGSTAYDQVWLTNLMVTWRDVMKSSNLRFGIYNMFNTPYMLIQPYYGGHAPTPAGDLEMQLSLDVAI